MDRIINNSYLLYGYLHFEVARVYKLFRHNVYHVGNGY